MDSLLEALSSGKAFKKEGRRRAPRGDKGRTHTSSVSCGLN